MDVEERRYQKVGGDVNMDLEKNGKIELDRKEDKRVSTKDCREGRKLANTIVTRKKRWIGHILARQA